MEGRHLVVADVALALVIQAVQDKSGSRSALLSQARSLEDDAMSAYGALMPVGSVLSLPPGVRPLPAPLANPPFGATAALDRSVDGAVGRGRCGLAYTAGGLAWLLGAVRCCGDPRFLSAMEAVARSGIVDRIGACLDLLPEAPTGPTKPRRAAATVAILLVCDKTDNLAATSQDSCESSVDTSGDDGSEDDGSGGEDDHGDRKDIRINNSGYGNPRSVPVAAAAMRNELPGVDPWVVVGRRDRLNAVGASAREACALLSATAACLVRDGASARLYVDAALIAPIDDAGFRRALDAAFGLASP